MFRIRKNARHSLLIHVLPFVLIILVQAFIAGASLHTLSFVRAYVGGESLWSKGQKDAVFFLEQYANTQDERFHEEFRRSLAIPLGDLDARLALEMSPPDYERAVRGLLQGGNHPKDVPGLMWLFVHFRDFIYMKDAVAKWRATDSIIHGLADLGDQIHAQLTAGAVDQENARSLNDKIYRFNTQATPFAVAFSESLGAGSRAIKELLTAVNLATASFLIVLLVWHIRNLLAQRQKFEQALIAEKERAQITLDSLDEAVVRLDAKGRVEYLNAAAERLIGRDARAAKGAIASSLF
jgi:PAS domain-containing protein